ncbi:P-loop containing nucleoside triphosphate hydrolase protein [Hygrophoropsis aurantiaca]|uniref:P-loop containing nucleoside triphosphate hydrolase protein n=1 Tax=Hygrophoropsis aurantiaca TaxID=72124 RepID=A0ACB7ZZT7_9AGAM|nr:P-loop containing nucleoside triphosphate hydrolase protein [Hygrophoropsis aurantiaca]
MESHTTPPVFSEISIEQIQEKTLATFGTLPCRFQAELCRAQLQKKDIISIAATGSGKTLTFLMPLQFSADSVVIVVTALNVLGDQFVCEAEAAGFSAISVTAENDNDKTFADIRAQKYRALIFNPEVLLKRGGRCETQLWKDKGFISRILNIVFDEGHCIIQWGSAFRDDYNRVDQLRFFLPNVPIYITSATIPPSMITDLKTKFHMENCTVFQRSNDRPNIHFSVRRMEHPQKSFWDLAFLIPSDWKDGDPLPPKFMIFFDNKKEAEAATTFLKERLPLALRDKVQWFHAGMTVFFRAEEISKFKSGETWGLGATDSGGMGLDVSDVILIVQWRVPKDLNTLMQRFGRAVRDFLLQGIAILIAEPDWFYGDMIASQERKRKRAEKKARKASSTNKQSKKQKNTSQVSTTAEANADASNSDSSDDEELSTRVSHLPSGPSTLDANIEKFILDANEASTSQKTSTAKKNTKKRSIDDAMRLFLNADVLTGAKRCRRFHSNAFFGNDKVPTPDHCCERCAPKVPRLCCDLCNPDAISQMVSKPSDSPPSIARAPAKVKVNAFEPSASEQELKAALFQWRDEQATALFGQNDFYSPDMFLHHTLVNRIVSLAHEFKLSNVTDLLNQTQWSFATRHGAAILDLVNRFCPKPAPLSPFVSTPLAQARLAIRVTLQQNQVDNSPLTKKTRAPSTCSRCGMLGHRMNSKLCPHNQIAGSSGAAHSEENVPPTPAHHPHAER